jgi:ADP-L-glycero-D-manno-heptose 6-epimerase
MYIVTGGAGFIGSNIAASLAGDGADVVVVDWLEVGDKWRNLASTRLHDVVTPPELPAFLAKHRAVIQGIVHMGAISATTERDGDRLVSQNIRLTLDLWEWCTTHAVPFIYASSAATYGDGAAGFDDNWQGDALAALQPLNGYGWSKHFVDRRISHDVALGRPTPPKWAGLKFFNVYGPNEQHKGSMRSVVHQIYPKIAAGEAITLFRSHHPDYADGGQMRDFVYVKDCVAVIRWMLDQSFTPGIFNIGSGSARTWLDLAHAVYAAADKEPSISFIDIPEAIRDRYQYFTQANMTRLKAAGCGHNFTSLEDGVRDYVEGYLAPGDFHV